MKTISSLLFVTIASVAFAGGGKFHLPTTETAPGFRDVDTTTGSWKVSNPSTPAPAIAPDWWTLFHDDTLNDLVTRALEHNQDLRAAAARVDQARAAAGLTRAAFLPSAQVDSVAARGRSLDTGYRDSDYALAPLTLNYEVDLWGRVRKAHRASRANAAGQAALFASARLSLAAETAQTYFALRASEREEAIVTASVETRREARDVIAARLRSGSAGELDVARAETELATAEAELAGVQQRRAVLQSALAVLAGAPAPTFALAASTANVDASTPPAIPAGLPSELLERRPDIHAAQLALVATHARIGVARAAFFPAISLTGAAGYESADFGDVFSWDQRIWSLGPRLYLPIFQGGRNRANLERAKAAYDETIANYRHRVLVAFRDVQDALTTARLLTTQIAAQDRAAASARRAAQLSRVRYDAGFVGYLEVVDSERSALAAERAVVQLNALRQFNTVTLIKSLGGGWATPTSVAAGR